MKKIFSLLLFFTFSIFQIISKAGYVPVFNDEFAIKSNGSLLKYDVILGEYKTEHIRDDIKYGYAKDGFYIKKDNSLWFYAKVTKSGNPKIVHEKIMDNVEMLCNEYSRSYMFNSLNDTTCMVVKTDETLWAWGEYWSFIPKGYADPSYSRDKKIYIPYNKAVKIADDVIWANFGSPTYFIKSDYSLWVYGRGIVPGYSQVEQFDIPTKIMDDVKYIGNGCILKTDGSLLFYNEGNITEPIMNNVRKIVSGNRYTVAVREDNTIWAWGNICGEYSERMEYWPDPPSELKYYDYPIKVGEDVKDIYCYGGNTILRTDGSLWGYGRYGIDKPTKIMQLCAFNVEGPATVKKGEEIELTSTYYDDNGNPYNDPNVTWSVESDGIVSLYPNGSRVKVKGEKGGKTKIIALHNPSGERVEYDFRVDDYRIDIAGRKPLKANEEIELGAFLYCGDEISGDAADYIWKIEDKEIAQITKNYGSGNSYVRIKGLKRGITTVRVTEQNSGSEREFKLLSDVQPKISVNCRSEKGDYGVTRIYFTVENEKYPELDYDDMTEEEYESLILKSPHINLTLPKAVYAINSERASADYIKNPSIHLSNNIIPNSKFDFSYDFVYGDEALISDDAFVNVAVCGEDFVPHCRSIDINMDLPVKVVVNGERVKFDAYPIIENGRTLVPVRKIFNALGTRDEDIIWDDATQKVTATVGGKRIELQIDTNVAYVDGEEKILDVPARIISGNRTYVPVRFIAESFGASVSWNGNCFVASIVSASEMIGKKSMTADIKPDKNGEDSGFTTEEKEKWFGLGETYSVYNGGELERGEYMTGNLVIKEPLVLPSYTKIFVKGYLNIENKIQFGENSGIYVTDGDISIKKKGILDMKNGGTLECDGDFIFNSGTNHEKYLSNGVISVGSDVCLKKNFNASGKHEFHILNKQNIHVIDVKNDSQEFNIFRVEERGFEVLDIKKEFACKKTPVFDDRSILSDYVSSGNELYGLSTGLPLGVVKGGSVADEKIKARVETGLTKAFLSDNCGSEIDLGKIDKSTKNIKIKSLNDSVTCKYYDSVSGKIKEYTLDIAYHEVIMAGSGARYGTVTYKDGKEQYIFNITMSPEQIENSLTSFKATVIKNMAEGVVGAYKSNYADPLVNNAKNVVKELIMNELGDDVNEIYTTTKDIKTYIKKLKDISDKLRKIG